MFKWLRIVIGTLRSAVGPHHDLALENLALRQQLAVFKHRYPRPRLNDSDRLFWVLLSRVWRNCSTALHVAQPATVVRWHRKGFKYYWRWKSHGRGRPKLDPEIRALIRQMWLSNPGWGVPRIHGELHLKRILSNYISYYHSARTHLSLHKDAPDGRAIQSPEQGTVVEISRVGGLHHEYVRMAARSKINL